LIKIDDKNTYIIINIISQYIMDKDKQKSKLKINRDDPMKLDPALAKLLELNGLWTKISRNETSRMVENHFEEKGSPIPKKNES